MLSQPPGKLPIPGKFTLLERSITLGNLRPMVAGNLK
jgi:hypothetical protein